MNVKFLSVQILAAAVLAIAIGSMPMSTRAAASEVDPATSNTSTKIAIVGGDIHTVTRGTVRRGTVLIEDGKIVAVGRGINVPEDAQVIDAAGQYVVPGFIALHMSGVGIRGAVDRRGQIKDALDPFDRNIKLLLGVGVTAGSVNLSDGAGRRRFGEPAELFPGLDDPEFAADEEGTVYEGEMLCPCCSLPILPTTYQEETPTPPSGQEQRSAVLRMSHGHLDSMLVKQSVFYDTSAGALMGALNRHNWRDQIERARQYLKDVEAHQKNTREGNREQPPRRPVPEDIVKVAQGEMTVRVRANTASEIREMIALARELDYKLVLTGVIEGWLVSNEIAEAQVPVIITPRRRIMPRIGDEDTSGSSIEMAGILQQSGVPFALGTLAESVSLNGIAGRDLTSLPLEAMFAVRGGADERTALESLTITPARILGLDDRLGSIEVGKEADVLIFSGPPLDYRSYVEKAIVAGRIAYDRHEDKVYPLPNGVAVE